MRSGQRNNPTNPDEEKKLAARERVRKHRESLRARGLRPIQIWVPDTRRPGFAEEARRQCLALDNDPQEKEIMEWIEQAQDTTGWV
ncbi:MAG TPA: antitoxin MazE family protein [Acidobacteriaceae bacterium]